MQLTVMLNGLHQQPVNLFKKERGPRTGAAKHRFCTSIRVPWVSVRTGTWLSPTSAAASRCLAVCLVWSSCLMLPDSSKQEGDI